MDRHARALEPGKRMPRRIPPALVAALAGAIVAAVAGLGGDPVTVLAAGGPVAVLAVALAWLADRRLEHQRVSAALLHAMAGRGDGVSIVDATTLRVLALTGPVTAITGRPPGELLGRDGTLLTDPQQVESLRERARLRAAGIHPPPRISTLVLRPDGERVPVELSINPLADGRLLVVSHDRSEPHRLEARVKEGRALATAVLDRVAMPVVAIVDGRVVLANGAACDVAGRERAEMIGRRPYDVGLRLDPGDEDGAAGVIEWIRPDGSVSGVLWSIQEAAERGGPGRCLVMVGTGAADVHNPGDGLVAAHEELVRAREELERLVSIASHDLREPLRAISGFADLLEREAGEGLSPRGREFLSMIQQAGARMEALLDGLSRYGRAGRAEAEPEPVDLEAALDHALAHLRSEIVAREAEITHDALPVVRADPNGVEQVLEQLISNALKFNDRDRPHVHVAARRRDSACELTVIDDGIGVPDRERDRVFELFRRLHPRDVYPGSGVGLAVARRIVQRNGGRIWVEDGPEGGSEFHVLLPADGAAA